MLVLTRSVYGEVSALCSSRENEVVVVLEDGRRIVFTVLPHGHSSGRIRVGIEAPRELTILRGELDGPDAEDGRRVVDALRETS